MLRQSIRQHQQALLGDQGTLQAEEAALRRLHERLAREGLLPSAQAVGASVRASWWQRLLPGRSAAMPAWSYAAVATLVVGVVIAVWRSTTPEIDVPVVDGPPPVIRGDSGVQQTQAVDAEARARRFAASLALLDARPVMYRQGRDIVVDVDVLPQHLPAAQRSADLAGLGRPLVGGLNRITFVEQRR